MKKKKWQLKMTRRQVLKAGMIGGAGMMLPLRFLPAKAWADPLGVGACSILGGVCTTNLHDPQWQIDNGAFFTELVPNALDPSFIWQPGSDGKYNVKIGPTIHNARLVDSGGSSLSTPIWGYGGLDGQKNYTWPGRTFQIVRNTGKTEVTWVNNLKPKVIGEHLLPVDTHLHWCYSLPGYTRYTIAKNGVPIITHLHGGHTDYQFDGNPEYFYTWKGQITGPQWDNVPGGFTNKFRYDNDVPAGTLWYHDHALGITRLNVYAGLAGFYFVRDQYDTGDDQNAYGLPYGPHELAYAIQDRMFKPNGELFYPALPGDPYYEGFITEEAGGLPDGFGPTALAEFFGDHMVVNGIVWPRTNVDQCWYRLRLLNGCDSRFLVIQFFEVPGGATDFSTVYSQLNFNVIGSDQGLGTTSSPMNTLVFEPGARYDILINFSGITNGRRVIMKNIGGDEPFGGTFPGEQPFTYTDRIMAFDVGSGTGGGTTTQPDPTPPYQGVDDTNQVLRRVALFEGRDEFSRLQPLLGTVKNESGTKAELNDTNVATAYAWHQPTTETPELGSTEIWEIYNFTADAHPVHLHLVNFEILDREDFEYDITGTQNVPQHNGTNGEAPEISNIRNFSAPGVLSGYYEDAPKDMVISLPGDPDAAQPTGQLVRIRAIFDKPGRYVWHCHILSHEDHEMMRVLEVVQPAPA